MNLSGKKISIIGLGKSNIPLLQFILEKYKDLEITVRDQKDSQIIKSKLEALNLNSINYIGGEK